MRPNHPQPYVRPLLVLALLGLGSSSCAVVDSSDVHPMHAVSVHGVVLDDLDWKRSFEGFVNRFDFPGNTTGGGIHYESFVGPDLSITAGYERRKYAIDLPGADNGTANEFWIGGRYYLNGKEKLQPFGTVGVGVSPGVNFEGGPQSDPYFAGRVGLGAAWFLDQHFALEAQAAYELATWNTELIGAGLTVEDKADGLVFLVGASFLF